MKNRIICLLMAMLMTVSLLPTAVWAEDTSPNQPATTNDDAVEWESAAPETDAQLDDVSLYSGSIIKSGKCGNNATYTLSDDGVLTISGKGAMTNFIYTDDDESTCPWHPHRWDIQTVVIEEGVTTIGDYAFAYSNIENVTIPNTVTSIGKGAFIGTYLTSVIIPEGVTDIKEFAFWRCGSLQTITLPTTLKTVGQGAFYAAENWDDEFYSELTDIYYGGGMGQFWNSIQGIRDSGIPDSVTIHYNGATGDTIDGGKCGDNVSWKLDKNDTLTIYGTGAMYDYPTSDGDNWWTDWNLPWKYCYDMIRRIVVEEGVTYLGIESLCTLRNATALSLPNSLTSIGQGALYGFGGTEITIPKNVTDIGNFTFNGCPNLKSVTLPAGLREIGLCFIECDDLETITFQGTMQQWIDCGGGRSIFPAKTTVICQGGGTMNLSGTCGDNLTWTLDNSGKLTISGIGEMYDYYHDDNGFTSPWAKLRSMIRSIEIGSGVTSIGAWAFEDTNITSLVIPSSVETIHDYGVCGNRYLTDVTLNEGLRVIGNGALSWNKRVTDLTIPDGVTTIGEEAFASCIIRLEKSKELIGLTTITIPGSVTSIGKDAFANCNLLKTVSFGGTQTQWNAIGGENAGVPSDASIYCITLGVITSGGTKPQASDMQALYEYLTGQAGTAYTQRQKKAADVNQDGMIDVYDLQYLYELVSGIRTA